MTEIAYARRNARAGAREFRSPALRAGVNDDQGSAAAGYKISPLDCLSKFVTLCAVRLRAARFASGLSARLRPNSRRILLKVAAGNFQYGIRMLSGCAWLEAKEEVLPVVPWYPVAALNVATTPRARTTMIDIANSFVFVAAVKLPLHRSFTAVMDVTRYFSGHTANTRTDHIRH